MLEPDEYIPIPDSTVVSTVMVLSTVFEKSYDVDQSKEVVLEALAPALKRPSNVALISAPMVALILMLLDTVLEKEVPTS